MFGEPVLFPAITSEEVDAIMEVLNDYQQGEKRVARTDRRYSNEYASQQAVIEKLEEMLLQEREKNAKYRESLLYVIAELDALAGNGTPWTKMPEMAKCVANNLRNAVGQ